MIDRCSDDDPVLEIEGGGRTEGLYRFRVGLDRLGGIFVGGDYLGCSEDRKDLETNSSTREKDTSLVLLNRWVFEDL